MLLNNLLKQMPKDGLSPELQALFDSSNAVGFSLSVKLNQTPLTAFEERFPISAFDWGVLELFG